MGVINGRRQDTVRDGSLRVTQNYAEVVYQETGALRVTQNYAEVIFQETGALRVTQNYAEVITDYY